MPRTWSFFSPQGHLWFSLLQGCGLLHPGFPSRPASPREITTLPAYKPSQGLNSLLTILSLGSSHYGSL